MNVTDLKTQKGVRTKTWTWNKTGGSPCIPMRTEKDAVIELCTREGSAAAIGEYTLKLKTMVQWYPKRSLERL